MKSSKAQIFSRVYVPPEIIFADVSLTSISGLALFQALFERLRLKARLKGCFTPRKGAPMCGMASENIMWGRAKGNVWKSIET